MFLLYYKTDWLRFSNAASGQSPEKSVAGLKIDAPSVFFPIAISGGIRTGRLVFFGFSRFRRRLFRRRFPGRRAILRPGVDLRLSGFQKRLGTGQPDSAGIGGFVSHHLFLIRSRGLMLTPPLHAARPHLTRARHRTTKALADVSIDMASKATRVNGVRPWVTRARQYYWQA